MIQIAHWVSFLDALLRWLVLSKGVAQVQVNHHSTRSKTEQTPKIRFSLSRGSAELVLLLSDSAIQSVYFDTIMLSSSEAIFTWDLSDLNRKKVNERSFPTSLSRVPFEVDSSLLMLLQCHSLDVFDLIGFTFRKREKWSSVKFSSVSRVLESPATRITSRNSWKRIHNTKPSVI